MLDPELAQRAPPQLWATASLPLCLTSALRHSHQPCGFGSRRDQLAKTLPDGCDRPALPARYPFRTARIVAYRQFALNSYLQLLLPLVHPDVHARRILLNFLSRSHLHWQ